MKLQAAVHERSATLTDVGPAGRVGARCATLQVTSTCGAAFQAFWSREPTHRDEADLLDCERLARAHGFAVSRSSVKAIRVATGPALELDNPELVGRVSWQGFDVRDPSAPDVVALEPMRLDAARRVYKWARGLGEALYSLTFKQFVDGVETLLRVEPRFVEELQPAGVPF